MPPSVPRWTSYPLEVMREAGVGHALSAAKEENKRMRTFRDGGDEHVQFRFRRHRFPDAPAVPDASTTAPSGRTHLLDIPFKGAGVWFPLSPPSSATRRGRARPTNGDCYGYR